MAIRQEERQMLLAIANRPVDNNTTFTTGGDVSRFQRRSVPARDGGSGDERVKAVSNLAGAIRGANGSSAGGPVGSCFARQYCDRRSGGSPLR